MTLTRWLAPYQGIHRIDTDHTTWWDVILTPAAGRAAQLRANCDELRLLRRSRSSSRFSAWRFLQTMQPRIALPCSWAVPRLCV